MLRMGRSMLEIFTIASTPGVSIVTRLCCAGPVVGQAHLRWCFCTFVQKWFCLYKNSVIKSKSLTN